MTRVADAIFERLKRENTCVFFVPGGGSMFMVDALGKSKIDRISSIHEAGAGAGALGWSMMSGRLGVVLVTSGPGATNAVTPCLAAWTDSVPVLFISGQAKSDTLIGDSGLRTRGVQEVDIIPMVTPITKKAYQPLTSGYDCTMALDAMIKLCMDGRRGPCFLSIPLDIQGMEI